MMLPKPVTEVIEMPDYRKMFDRDYIGHFDLDGKDVTVEIARVVAGELTAIGGRKSKKPIIYFAGKEKGMIVNKTNAKLIAALYGTMTEAWVGKRITLYVSTTRNPDGTGDVECIRVRPQAPKKGSKAAETTPESTAPVDPDHAFTDMKDDVV